MMISALLFLTAPPQADRKLADDHYQKGAQYFRSGRIKRSESSSPSSVWIRQMLAAGKVWASLSPPKETTGAPKSR
jgi:hypothetical protein